jgi:hypothetical protein
MINNNKKDILQGQISIFDLELGQTQKSKKEIEPIVSNKPRINNKDKFTEIINLYRNTAARIVQRVSGALLVEIEEKTLYFNSAGVNEFNLKKDIELMPADEILVANQDREVNERQLKKLEDMHVDQYIKRKGDVNVIIPLGNKTIVINPKGWILEYLQKPKYHENEIFVTKVAEKITVLDNKVTEMAINTTKSVSVEDKGEDLQIGDRVRFNYGGPQEGNVASIYNNGETVNVVWDHKHTAFYYKCVSKIS